MAGDATLDTSGENGDLPAAVAAPPSRQKGSLGRRRCPGEVGRSQSEDGPGKSRARGREPRAEMGEATADSEALHARSGRLLGEFSALVCLARLALFGDVFTILV